MGNRKTGPDFICIGAQKAGTTWLHSILEKNPLISFPGPKEVHFWDLFYEKGIEWYKDLYSSQSRNILQGDITPSYSIINKQKIKECHKLNPHVRIIYILRNPIDRAWSAAMMNVRKIAKENTFEGQSLSSLHFSDQFFIFHAMLQSSLRRGDYATCISNWLLFFDREQILILDYEDIAKEPRKVIEKVQKHIGLSADTLYLSNETLNKKIFSNTSEGMRNTFKISMSKEYKNKIMNLTTLLEQDYSKWIYDLDRDS